jgi:hypothetical protein
LFVDGNPLTFPPPQVIEQGTPAILQFLRHPTPYPPYQLNLIPIMVVAITLLTLAGLLRAWARLLTPPGIRAR